MVVKDTSGKIVILRIDLEVARVEAEEEAEEEAGEVAPQIKHQ